MIILTRVVIDVVIVSIMMMTMMLREGIKMKPKSVEAILGMEPPRTGAETASLLGAAGYYSRFIRDYAMIVRPLRKLQMKMAKYKSTPHKSTASEPEGDLDVGKHHRCMSNASSRDSSTSR